MSPSQPLDLQLATWLERKMKYYKFKRTKKIDKKEQESWNNLFYKNDFIVHQLDENLQIKLYKDSVLANYIYKGFEKSEVAFLEDYLKEGDAFVDIGSNIGFFSLYAAKRVGLAGSVLAIEPTPVTFKRLQENIEFNSFTNITAYNIGLSSSKGKLKLYLSSDGRDAWNTFGGNHDNKFSSFTEVEVNTLDNILSESKIDKSKIKLIKIDVEGWEIPVIEGGLQTFEDYPGIAILVEFAEKNSFASGFNCWDLYDILHKKGYTWAIYDQQKKQLVAQEKKIHYHYDNLIAVKDLDLANKKLLS